MKLRIEEAGDADRDEWESLTRDSANGTLFHRLDFLDYHPAGRFRFRHLIFRDEHRTLALLPAALATDETGPHLRSPSGASFGGPVLARGMSEATIAGIMESLTDYASAAGWSGISITPPPAIYWREDCSEYRDLLIRSLERIGFRRAVTEIIQVVPLDGCEEDLWGSVNRAGKKAVNKARREGMRIEETRDWPVFYTILQENRRRHGAVPTHSLTELERLDELVGRDLLLLVAFSGCEPAGGTLIFRAQDRVALNFYLCHTEQWQENRPSDLLVWESILWARKNGCRYYDFGTTSVEGELNQGLWRFKAKFGAVDSTRDSYTLRLREGTG